MSGRLPAGGWARQPEEDEFYGDAAAAAAAFAEGPVGRALEAFERGDAVLQYEHDLVEQRAVIVAMVGSATVKRAADPSEILSGICRQGWELVNGTVVFVHEGSQSRDKFLSSGQNLAVKGRVVGYYLFRRAGGRHTG